MCLVISLGHDLVLERQIDALVIVQVPTANLLVVKGEEFVEFALQLLCVVQSNARIANAGYDFKRSSLFDGDLVAKCSPKWIVTYGLYEVNGRLRMLDIRGMNDRNTCCEIG